MTTRVVLLSGGIDSYLAYRMSETMDGHTIPMFVNYGQPYLSKELLAVQALIPKDLLVVVEADLVSKQLDNVPTLHQQEIFGRNLLLAFYGALLGDEVWLSALETEMNPTAVKDKQPEFLSMTSALLTFLMKGKRLETKVCTPFSELSKTEIITEGLLNWGVTSEELMTTVSCYHETHSHCGECSTCFKRWIAMSNHDIEEDYATNPWENAYAQKVTQEMRVLAKTKTEDDAPELKMGRYSIRRMIETHNALLKQTGQGLWDHKDELEFPYTY